MAGRARRWKPPAGWSKCPKLRKDYEENGKALGRLYLWHEDKAVEAWKMLGGVLGPKWKLEVYRFHWIRDNPADYEKYKQARFITRRRHDRLGL